MTQSLYHCRVVDTYEEFANTLEHISSEEDLKWYSVNYGTDMSYNWPEFEVRTLTNISTHTHTHTRTHTHTHTHTHTTQHNTTHTHTHTHTHTYNTTHTHITHTGLRHGTTVILHKTDQHILKLITVGIRDGQWPQWPSSEDPQVGIGIRELLD